MEGQESHRNSGRAGGSEGFAAAVAGIQGGAAADHRHQPVARRPAALRLLLGHRRATAIRCIRSLRAPAHRDRTDRRHVRRTAHPVQSSKRLNGGPQMVELSRDGRRVYLTNGLYSPWDEQFYPDGLKGWMLKLDAKPEGGMALDSRFFLEMEQTVRCHQVRLQGGDASSDSFCFS